MNAPALDAGVPCVRFTPAPLHVKEGRQAAFRMQIWRRREGVITMNKTTYQVEMSTDGRHKVMVTVEDPAGTDAALAWARGTYAKLLRGETPSTNPAQDASDEAPTCAVHDVAMVLVQGKQGEFWSCHQKNEDGSWCSYKPEAR